MVAWGLTVQVIAAIVAIIVIMSSTSTSGLEARTTVATWIIMLTSIIGTMLCFLGCNGMMPHLKHRGIPTSGALLLSIYFGLSLLQTIFAVAGFMPYLVNSMNILMFVGLAVLLLAWIGTSRLAGYVRGMGVTRAGYAVNTIALTLIVFLLIIFKDVPTHSSHMSYSQSAGTLQFVGIVGLLAGLALLVGSILIIVGWWLAVGGARELDQEPIYESAENNK